MWDHISERYSNHDNLNLTITIIIIIIINVVHGLTKSIEVYYQLNNATCDSEFTVCLHTIQPTLQANLPLTLRCYDFISHYLTAKSVTMNFC
jgi:hypothetical protein